jgi:hypothetical protein
MKMHALYLLRVAFVAVVFSLAASAFAEFSSSNSFPDPFGSYYSTNTAFYPTLSGLVTLEGLTLSSPTLSIPPPAAPGTAIWGGGKTFNALTRMSFFGGPTLTSFNPGDSAAASITGLVDAPPLHTYATEMLSLDLVGLPFGAWIRESPTLVSTGGHTIVDTPPSGFQISSFFDVFTELSLDGGASWTPATGPVHLVNPEPSSLILLASAGALLISRHRRRAA